MTASEIRRSMACSYDINFKFMVIQHTQETNNCAAAWDFHVAEQNLWCWRKWKELLLRAANSNL